jgi:glycosyltransferase involved in cell wall biosynthesis
MINKEEKNKKLKRRFFYKKKLRNRDNFKERQMSDEQNFDSQEFKKILSSDQMLSVVIPLYNEEESLMELSLSLKRVFDSLKCNYEVIFIDDGSKDGSFEKIKEINKRNSRYHCIKLRRNYGKSAALSAGFREAKGDVVITMDADLQDDPNEIPELIKTLNSGYDLVSGWKKVRYDPFIKRNTSKIFNYFTSKVSGIRLHDFNCGLKAYRKDVIKSVKVYGEMHRYIPALAHLMGFKVTEKVVKHHPRKFGVTKFGANRFLNGFFDLLTVAFTSKFIKKPLHLFGTLGIISSFAGFAITLYLTILKFFGNESISNRPLFLVGILLIIVGFQSFSLGLIAEMITKSSHQDEDIFIETTL